MNIVLKFLLNYSKQETIETGWKHIAEILTPIYHFTPSFYQTIHVVTHAYIEALNEPKYELGGSQNNHIYQVLSAPITSYHPLISGIPQLTDSFTIEEFYTIMLDHMISNLRITRVDWCINELKAV